MVRLFSAVTQRASTLTKKIKKLPVWTQLARRPFLTVGLLLLITLGLIVLSARLRAPDQADKPVPPTTPVRIYTIGSAPEITVQAKVEKEGVIRIVAQTGGVVNKIYVKEGQTINRGQALLGFGSSYLGGNPATVQRQIAQKQLENIEQTLPLQKESIQKQRELAEKSDANNDELQKISDQSLGETRGLLALNDTILQTLDKNLQQYEATNSGDINAGLIMSTRQMKSQLLAGQNQLRSALRATEYQVNNDKPPAQLSNLQRELTLKQLEVQEKSLELSKEIADLQVKLARISESAFYPASPVRGVVERVHVRPSQLVNPGATLFTISSDKGSTSLTILLSAEYERALDTTEPAKMLSKDTWLPLRLAYVSQEATEGTLFSARYIVEESLESTLTDGQFVSITIPVGQAQTGSTVPFVPVDAVFQTNGTATVYLVGADSLAVSRQVKLGSMVGNYVTVESGLEKSDQVIIDRTIIAGDKVEILR